MALASNVTSGGASAITRGSSYRRRALLSQPRLARIPTWLLTVAALAVCAPEALGAPPVFSRTLRGRLAVAGNTLGLDGSATAATAPGTRGGLGAFIANPVDWGTSRFGTFPVGTTDDRAKLGSAAWLDLPAGARVASAWLIWGCSSQVNGSPATPVTSPTTATLTLPSGIRQTISPTGEDTSLSLVSASFRYYLRWAPVTAAVAAGGPGRYVVSGLAGTALASGVTACGWTLVAVQERDDFPLRNINLWVLAEEVRYNGTGCPCDTEVEVAGFCTPAAPVTPTGRLFMTAMEGDARYFNDHLAVEDPAEASWFMPLQGPNNAWDNFFGSQVNGDAGTLDLRGTFGDRNHRVDPTDGEAFSLVPGARVGWDLTVVPVNDDDHNPDVLGNSQSRTALLVTSGGAPGVEGDDFILGAVGLELDVASPRVTATVTHDAPLAIAGERITSTITIQNAGNTAADDVKMCVTLPGHASFAGRVTVDGVERAGVTADTLAPTGCVTNGGGVSLGPLDVGRTRTVTVAWQADSVGAPPLDRVTLTPSFRAVWTPPCEDAVPEADLRTIPGPEVPGAAFSLALSATPETPPALDLGATVTWELTVANTGPNVLANPRLRLAVPEGVTLVTGSARVAGAAVGAGWPFQTGAALPPLPVGGTLTVSFAATATARTSTVLAVTGWLDPDSDGPATERASNTVYTHLRGEIVVPVDTDRDGVIDDDDNCPVVANPSQDNHYDGMRYMPAGATDEGDACDDSDGDGLMDAAEDRGGDGPEATETDALKVDTDGDGLCDGAQPVAPCAGAEDTDGDADRADWGSREPSPIDPDSDGDGVCDGGRPAGSRADCLAGELGNGTSPLRSDTDGDGLCDGPGGGTGDGSGCVGDETRADGRFNAGQETNPARSDTDGDGLCDGFLNGAADCQGGEDRDGDGDARDWTAGASETDPLAADTDGGGTDDGIEVLTQGTDPRDRCVGDLVNCDVGDDDNDDIPNTVDPCLDRDGDGYGVGDGCRGPDCDDLVATCTTDCETDRDGADGDGVPDCAEVCADADGDTFGQGPSCLGPDCDDAQAACTTDCSDLDGDGAPNCVDDDDDADGLADLLENERGYDPRNPDTDGDGLGDREEHAIFGTDPRTADSDGDGLRDDDELADWQTDPTQADSDGDGLGDGEELNTVGSDPRNPDSDGGGQRDGDEVQLGSNPNDARDDFSRGGATDSGCGCSGAGAGAGGMAMGLLVVGWLAARARRRAVAR